MTTPLRLALFGVGLIGRRHLAITAKQTDCEIVAAADVSASARESAERHGVRFYTDHRTLLSEERLDGVIIATPNNTHAPVGLDCVHAGLPMLVEKPLTDSLASGRALLQAANRAGVAIAVGHHRRFDPAVELAKAMLDKEELGTLAAIQVTWALRKHDAYYDTSWRTARVSGGGPGLINLIHDIDLMRHFAGDIERVYAELGHGARDIDVEDSIAATIRFRTGTLGTIVTSDATPSPWGWEQGSGENPDVPETARNCYRLLGTKAALALPRLEIYRHDSHTLADWRGRISPTPIAHGPRSALASQLADFCAVIRGQKSPRVDGLNGFASLAATLAIIRSGDSACAVYPEGVNATE